MTNEPPRAYSAHQSDFNYEVGARLEILLNGEVQEEVIEYDIDRGYVLFNVVDENGNAQLNDAKDDVLRESVQGQNVEARWKVEA